MQTGVLHIQDHRNALRLATWITKQRASIKLNWTERKKFLVLKKHMKHKLSEENRVEIISLLNLPFGVRLGRLLQNGSFKQVSWSRGVLQCLDGNLIE